MNSLNDSNPEDFKIRIIQSGKTKSYSLTEENLNRKFLEIYNPLIKKLKLKQGDIYLTNEEGRALHNIDLNLSLKKIIEKFGKKINLYYEKIM